MTAANAAQHPTARRPAGTNIGPGTKTSAGTAGKQATRKRNECQCWCGDRKIANATGGRGQANNARTRAGGAKQG